MENHVLQVREELSGAPVTGWFSAFGIRVLVLLALTEGMGGLFDSIFSLWETWEFLRSGVLPFLSSLVPYFFSCNSTGPSFITSTVVLHLFHIEIPIFHINLTAWKDVSLRKCGVFLVKSALPNVCLKDVTSMEGTNNNHPKSRPLGSKLQQRAFWIILCQTFKPV